MKCIIAVLVLLLGLPAAAQAKPKPLPPEQALAAIDAAPVQVMNSARKASPAEVLDASSIPGAVTESLPGMTVEQATGYSTPTARRLAVTGSGCATVGLGWRWGTWPYHQQVNDYTYYCWQDNAITYRTTHVTTDSFFCDASGPYAFRLDGGVGYGYVHTESGAYFSCPLVGVSVNRHQWMRNYYMPGPTFPHWTADHS